MPLLVCCNEWSEVYDKSPWINDGWRDRAQLFLWSILDTKCQISPLSACVSNVRLYDVMYHAFEVCGRRYEPRRGVGACALCSAGGGGSQKQRERYVVNEWSRFETANLCYRRTGNFLESWLHICLSVYFYRLYRTSFIWLDNPFSVLFHQIRF